MIVVSSKWARLLAAAGLLAAAVALGLWTAHELEAIIAIASQPAPARQGATGPELSEKARRLLNEALRGEAAPPDEHTLVGELARKLFGKDKVQLDDGRAGPEDEPVYAEEKDEGEPTPEDLLPRWIDGQRVKWFYKEVPGRDEPLTAEEEKALKEAVPDWFTVARLALPVKLTRKRMVDLIGKPDFAESDLLGHSMLFYQYREGRWATFFFDREGRMIAAEVKELLSGSRLIRKGAQPVRGF